MRFLILQKYKELTALQRAKYDLKKEKEQSAASVSAKKEFAYAKVSLSCCQYEYMNQCNYL